jgi:hypothetical protein
VKNLGKGVALAVMIGQLSQACGASDDKKKVRGTEPHAGQGGEGGGEAGGASEGGQFGAGAESGMTAAGLGGTAGDSSVAGAAGAGSAADCPSGFDECDGDLSQACEQALTELSSCGSCDTACTNAHGGIACEELACKVTSCDAGYDDCNGDPNDGCETALIGNDENCGACGRDCTSVGATCKVDSCGDIRMQTGVSIGTGNGPINDRAFAFSSTTGIANMTRTNSVVQLFPLDGSPGKVIWNSTNGESGNETLVIDGQEIFWAQRATPSIVRKKLATQASAALPTDAFFPEYLPAFLRLQGDYFYWITGDYFQPGYVYRRLRSAAANDPGTRIVNVAQGSSSTVSSIAAFAVTTDAIYWTTGDDSDPATLDNDIRTVPLIGGVPTSVPKVPGASNGAIREVFQPSFAAVGDSLYFARTVGTSPLNGIYRFKQGDAAPTKIAEADNVTTFAVGEAFVYYGLASQQGVWRAPLTGGQGVKVGQDYQTTIVGVDATFAYVAFVNAPSYFYKIFQ